MISIIDAFENNVGVDLTLKNAADLRKLNDKQVGALTDGCLEFMTQFSQTFETAIDVSTENNHCAYLERGYTTLYHLVGDLVTTTTRLDLVSRFLLYYPSVAISDAFLIKNWDIPEMREYLSLYFTNVASLAPLIKKGVVYLVPYLPADVHNGIKQPAQSLVQEFIKSHKEEEFEDRASRDYSFERFAHQFTISSYFDSFVPYLGQSYLLQEVLKKASILPSIEKEMEATIVANILHDIQLPKLEELSINDILAIRDNDEAFSRWRSQLQRILLHQHLLAATGREVSAKDFQLLAEPLLVEEAARLREGIKAKRGIRYIKDSFVGFSMTAISTVASSGIASLDWKKLAAGSVTGLLYSLIFKRSSKTDKALLKHYSLFEGLINPNSKTG